MESEERPAKIRKLGHGAEPSTSGVTDDTLASVQQGEKPESQHEEVVKNDVQGEEETVLENSQPENGDPAAPKLSKSAMKKLARHEKWESGREDRKAKRKEKMKAKRERVREERRQQAAQESADGTPVPAAPGRRVEKGTKVPITIIFDCDFEDLMHDSEMKSLGLQITRSYSDNRKAKFQTHLAVSSFGGKMKERFDGILAKQYTSWKDVRFFSEDFVEVAEKAKEWMSGPRGGAVAGALSEDAEVKDEEEGEIVYLSSESDVTLDRLKPNSTYIIGGLVDHNRYKGHCYKRAVDRGIKTAKLPIGEFLRMKDRKVLVTNHVLEIMLKWLEFGDWGKAFIEVLPKRKGGVLKSEAESAQEADEGEEAEEEEGEETEAKGAEEKAEGDRAKAGEEEEDKERANAGAEEGAKEG
ncbi:hypothetical protein M011DRAFT_463186 [Sporormia fimetaria CBS 119925]|uniref:tRNA (guanine(9)-N1)-methyltransferase n=1 Tax=Sporormia fimetaria CBS 119925 TaxID=1340428 RepID=A0A6A6VPH8_9PLEO|nr:hypothetical protein M011DRAFT_463186 [Sporormia fimetaria CBS 119925]